MNLESNLDVILNKYQTSFSDKVYSEENDESDLLMDAFGITAQLKRENRQYWGRELGKCWESLIVEVCRNTDGFQPALRVGDDEPCDLRMNDNGNNYAIDTKYRVGSGDSGTLKKFKQYGSLLQDRGFEPALVFLREDNLPAAITACTTGGWTIYTGQDSFDFIYNISGFDIKNYLTRKAHSFPVAR